MLRPALLGSVGVLFGLLPLAAFASNPMLNDIPNGLAVGCVACHQQMNDPSLNLFGQDVKAGFVGGLPNWAALFDLDSDGDGQTNGEELGDPCGTWRKGRTPPRTTNISNPGRATSLSATPKVPECAALDAGLPDLGPPDTGRPDLGPADTGAFDLGVQDAGPRDLGFLPRPDAGLVDAGAPLDSGGCRCVSPTRRSLEAGPLGLLLLGLVLLRRRPAHFAG